MTFNKIYRIIPAAGFAAALLLCGCEKQWDGHQKGNVQFTAAAASSADTKAVWGEDVPTTNVQRIDWVSGDLIRIASNYAKAGSSDQATYKLTADGTHKSTTDPWSYGKIEPVGAGLVWDEQYLKSEHKFWGVYPDRDITTKSDGHYITGNTGTRKTGFEDDLLLVSSLEAGDKSTVSSSSYDMMNQPGATISMYFFPAFTTMQFSLTNETTEPVEVKNIKITSKSPIQGTFEARIAENGVDKVTVSSDTKKRGNSDTYYEVAQHSIWSAPDGVGVTSDTFIPASEFKDAVGCKVNVYITKTYEYYYAISFMHKHFEYEEKVVEEALYLPELNGNVFSNQHYPQGFSATQNEQTYFSFTLSQEIWNKISSKELTISLGKCYLHKLVYLDGSSEKEIWRSSAAEGYDSDGTVSINAEAFANAVGRQIRVYVTLPDIWWWNLEFKVQYKYNELKLGDWWEALTLQEIVNNEGKNSNILASDYSPGSAAPYNKEWAFTFTLTTEVWEKILASGGLNICSFNNCTLNKITYDGQGKEEFLYYDEEGIDNTLKSTEKLSTQYFTLLPIDITLEKIIVEFGDGTTKSLKISDYEFKAGKQYRVHASLPGSGDNLELVGIDVRTMGQSFGGEVRQWSTDWK